MMGVPMSMCVAIVTRAAWANHLRHEARDKAMDIRDMRHIAKAMAKRGWDKWVRFASRVEADPITLTVPVSALLVGLMIILFT